MSTKGNRYENAQYSKLGAWLRSKCGQAELIKSQQSGNAFTAKLKQDLVVKDTVLRERCTL